MYIHRMKIIMSVTMSNSALYVEAPTPTKDSVDEDGIVSQSDECQGRWRLQVCINTTQVMGHEEWLHQCHHLFLDFISRSCFSSFSWK